MATLVVFVLMMFLGHPAIVISANMEPVVVSVDGDGNSGNTFENTESCVAEPMYLTTQAVAVILGDGSDVSGTIQFDQPNGAGSVQVTGSIMGLEAGLHGFYILEYGNIGDGCAGAGGQFNPDVTTTTSWNRNTGGTGDLGDISADQNGIATVNFMNDVLSLNGHTANIVGRTVAVYATNGGRGKGSAGAVIACGVIGISAQEVNPAFKSA